MRLICPSCGAIASLEAWINDSDAREVIRAVSEMEAEVSRAVVRYLGLFRSPGGRGLTWHRAGKLVREIKEYMFASEIVWDKQRPLSNLPVFWLRAIETILERDGQGKVRRPLKNHNLLRTIAYDIASRQEGQLEREKEQRLQYRKIETSKDAEMPKTLEEAREIARRNLQRFKVFHGKETGNPGLMQEARPEHAVS